jgi:hypothetical protein
MSDLTQPNNPPGFIWILGAFAAFAVSLTLTQAYFGNTVSDPAAVDRLANKVEILAVQNALLSKMNLVQGKSADTLLKHVDFLNAQKASISAMVIPGSPTQLKQAALQAVQPGAVNKSAVVPTPVSPTPAPAK